MHCVFLGIVKQFLSLWLESKDCVYSISSAKSFDEALAKMKLPDEILRCYRSYERYGKKWKASEYRNWLLFFSPVVLKSLLPREHYRHWLYLVNCCRILSQKKIKVEELELAELLAMSFIAKIPKLYGKQHVTYNVHLLQHVIESTRNWGAPWSYSAFLYEDAGGHLSKQFHGTRSVATQMFQRFTARQLLREFASNHIPHAADEIISQLYITRFDCKLFNRQLSNNSHMMEKLLGKPSLIKLPAAVVIDLEKWSQVPNIICQNAVSHERLSLNGKIFSSKSYCQNFKRDNSIDRIKHVTTPVCIEQFVLFDSSCNCANNEPCSIISNSNKENLQLVAIGHVLKIRDFSRHNDAYCNNLDLTGFMKVVLPQEYPQIIIFRPRDILFKCVFVPNQEDVNVVIINNARFEMD